RFARAHTNLTHPHHKGSAQGLQGGRRQGRRGAPAEPLHARRARQERTGLGADCARGQGAWLCLRKQATEGAIVTLVTLYRSAGPRGAASSTAKRLATKQGAMRTSRGASLCMFSDAGRPAGGASVAHRLQHLSEPMGSAAWGRGSRL